MYLSLEACRQLKEWGCDVESKWWSVVDSDTNRRKIIPSPYNKYYGIEKDYWCCGKGKDARIENNAIWDTYDLRDIICNGELSIKFFGEIIICSECLSRYVEHADEYEHCNCKADVIDNDVYNIGYSIDIHTIKILRLLQENKQEEAEEYFMKHNIFNPNNK